MLTVIMLGIAVLITALGGYFLHYAGRMSRTDRAFRAGAVRARARVVDLNEIVTRPAALHWNAPGRSGPPMPSYFPVVDFPLPDGHDIRVQVMYGSRPAPAHPGVEVEVLYDPADLERVSLDDGLATGRAGHVLFIILGSAMIAFAVFLVLVWVLLVPVLHVPV